MIKILTMTSIMAMNILAGGHFNRLADSQFPDAEPGIEHGVSAPYAGTIGSTLLVAGGCNFPDSALAPKSKKRFYKGIYNIQTDNSGSTRWTMIGTLPKPMAYGVAATFGNSIIMAGGCNDDGSMADVYRIEMVDGKAQVSILPQLPCTVDNMAGAVVGNRFYVVGGIANGKASNRVFSIDMDNAEKGWQEVSPFPGIARVQPVAGSIGKNRLCIFGGFSLAEGNNKAELALDGYAYDETTDEWTRLDGPKDAYGEDIFLGGSAALNTAEDSLLVIGGVNKDVFLNALNNPQPGYLYKPIEWYHFNPYTLLYNKGQWQIIANDTATARAGAAMAKTEKGVFVVGGELKPRIRTSQVLLFENK